MEIELDEQDLREGLKFIVGTWQVDYIVYAFSNNLEHIPAKEFKSNDGKDFSQISFEFFEDHSLKLKNTATGQEESATWAQKSYGSFTYTFDNFFGNLDPQMRKATEELNKGQNGELVFGLGFIAIGIKKIADGVVTEQKKLDIGDIAPSEDDLKMNDIVGRWKIYKTYAAIGDKFDLFTKEEVVASLDQKKAAGEIDQDDYNSALKAFGTIIEFTADHNVVTYMPIPPHITQKDIDEAVASGQIKVVDRMIVDDSPHEWKALNGDYWYNTHEHREVFGEIKSPWDKITPDENGNIAFQMFVLEKM